MDDYSYLIYHRIRARELSAEAAECRSVLRFRRARRMEIVRTLLHAVNLTCKAARAARHDAWRESIEALRVQRTIRTA